MPQPIENKLGAEPIVEQAVVVGSDRKFCAALIFPAEEALRTRAEAQGIDVDRSLADLLRDPGVRTMYQELVDKANEGMDHWSTVKRFALVPHALTIESGLLTPTMKVKRPQVRGTFQKEIDALYDEADREKQQRDSVIVS
jgi:long-chain acyl-CoA synthetase